MGQCLGLDQSARNFSSAQLGKAIKKALNEAANYAQNSTAGEGKFADNPDIRIGLPEQLEGLKDVLSKIGMEKQLGRLEKQMNNCAEKACSGTAAVFKGVISKMTVDDAKDLIQDENPTAMTDHLRSESEDQLEENMRPEIQRGMKESKLGAVWKKFQKTYKKMRKKLSGGQGMMGGMMAMVGSASELPELDVDMEQYILDKGLGAIFTFLEEKEAEIRDNPAGAGSKLVSDVFAKYGPNAPTESGSEGDDSDDSEDSGDDDSEEGTSSHSTS